jgi:putative ABC transport system permease protein
MAWYHRLFNTFRPEHISRDIEREMAFHIGERVDDLRAGGMSEAEARLVARRQFGNQTLQHERTRDVDVVQWLQSVAADVRYALRALRHSPGFAAVAILSLALGIGANTTIFTLLDSLVLRPLPVANPHQLAAITYGDKPVSGEYFTNPLWEQIRDRQDAFSVLTAFGETSFNLTEGGEARRIPGSYVSGDYFNVFAVAPAIGRLLTRSDDVRGCAAIAVLNYRFWQREYGSARDVVGRSIRLSGHPFEIVGVAGATFRGPDVGREPSVYLPICSEPVVRGAASSLDQRGHWWLRVIGRLAPGVDVAQAGARMAAIARTVYEQTIPRHWAADSQREYVTRSLHVYPAGRGFSEMRSEYRTALYALMAGVGLILLIACANVANLLLSRAEARHREVAIRVAIGAGRSRLLRQMLTESLVLALAGTALGLVIAQAGSRAMVGMIVAQGPAGPVSLDLGLNARLLAFTIATATTTVLLCGLVPAWKATRIGPQAVMKAQARGVVEGHSRWTLGKALVVAQIALSLVLVVSAGLLVGTFRNLSRLDPGFNADGVLLVETDLRRAEVPASGVAAMHRAILDRVRETPGVVSASSADLVPIGGMSWNDELVVDGYSPKSMMDAVTWFNEVSDAYFATMDTRLIAGRDFDATDVPGSEKAAIVNDAWGRKFFGNDSPLGRHFRVKVGDSLTPPYTIVGVVENAAYKSLRAGVEPTAYVASSQNAAPGPIRILEVRTNAAEPTSLVPAVKQVMRDIHPGITLEFGTLARQIGDSLQRERMLAVLSGLFGALALALALLGLYGVMSYSVARRRSEIGVRIALGAVRGRVIRMVLSEVTIVVVMGILIGVAGATAASRMVTTFLYGVGPREPGVYLLAVGMLALVALGAGLVPAWRAARVDPIEALREE